MPVKALTPQEEQRLWRISLIVASPILILFLIWFAPLLNKPSTSLWEYWVSGMMAFALFFPLALLLSFEIQYYLKEKKNGKFHAVKMAKQAGLILMSVVVATATAFLSSFYIAPLTGFWYATLAWPFLTIFMLGIIAYETKRFFSTVRAANY